MKWQLLGAVAFCLQVELVAMERKLELSVRQEQQETAVVPMGKQEIYNADAVKQALREEFNQRGFTNFPPGVIALIAGYNQNYAPFLPAMVMRQAFQIPSALYAKIDRVVPLPQNMLAISYKDSDLVKIFNRDTRKVVAEFSYGQKKGGHYVVATPDGRYIITAEPQGQNAKVWDVATYKQMSTYTCGKGQYIAAVMKNGYIVIGSWGKTVDEVKHVSFYDPIKGTIVRTITLPITYAVFNERSLDMNGMIRGASDRLTITVAEHMPNGNIVIGLNDGMVYIYDIKSQKFTAIKAHTKSITTLVFTGNDRIVAGATDGMVAVIHVPSAAIIKRFSSGSGSVASLAYLDNDAMSELFVGSESEGRNSAELVRSWDLIAEPTVQDKSFAGTKSIISLGDESFVVPIHKLVGDNFATAKELHVFTISPEAKKEVLKLASSELKQLQQLIAKLEEKAFTAHKNNVAIFLDEGTNKELAGLNASIRNSLISYYNIPVKVPKKDTDLDENDPMELGHAIACTIL